jgi:membrane fusion protein (multidrug efflux system)
MRSTQKIRLYHYTAAISVVLFVLSCSKQEAGSGQYARPAMPVETAPVKVQTVTNEFEAVGSFEADEVVTIVSEIDGKVLNLPFEEGKRINKGQLIAKLDDSQLAAEVARAEALRDQSKVTYGRIKTVVDQKAGTVQDLDNAAAELKVAEANLALAKARFAKTRIVAPFDGRIGVRHVSVGTFLRAGQKIAEVANLDNMRVSFPVPERYLNQLKRGGKVLVSTSAHPQEQETGQIIAIEPVVDPDTRNGHVIARVPNQKQNFFPGMSANISTVLYERDDALTIPSEAVFANGNQSYVYLVNQDSTVSQVEVKLGTQLSDVVEIDSGLAAGSIIVKAGHQKLYNGAKVMPLVIQNTALN